MTAAYDFVRIKAFKQSKCTNSISSNGTLIMTLESFNKIVSDNGLYKMNAQYLQLLEQQAVNNLDVYISMCSAGTTLKRQGIISMSRNLSLCLRDNNRTCNFLQFYFF